MQYTCTNHLVSWLIQERVFASLPTVSARSEESCKSHLFLVHSSTAGVFSRIAVAAKHLQLLAAGC